MKKNMLRVTLLAVFIILVMLINMPLTDENKTKAFTLPGLPQPIAEEPIVITSAGQSTDTYIVYDIANRLMIRSYFMPQAIDIEIKEAKTIVFVVGYSSLGMKLQGKSYVQEKERIEELIKNTHNNCTIVTVAMRGEQQYDNKTAELLRLVCSHSDYLIGMRESSNEIILAEIAREKDIPLTLVAGVNDIAEPFASAFR